MENKPRFAPSLLCMDMMCVREQIEAMDLYMDEYHIDIMDTVFVHNLGLSPEFARQLRPLTKKDITCHLMTAEPLMWIPRLLEADVNTISVHAETIVTGAFSVISAVKDAKKNFGIVLNPSTKVDVIDPYRDFVDRVTIMTIEPGFPGARFIPSMLKKIEEAVAYRRKHNLHYVIEIDGSCSADNFSALRDAGTDIFVVGTAALFSQSSDMKEACEKMLKNFGAN